MDHGAWLRNCYKSMTNRAGDLCDISTGSNPISFPRSSEEAGSVSEEADDRPDEEEISEAGPSEEEEEEDDDVEEIEEPVAIQVESVAHRLVRDCKAESYPFFLLLSTVLPVINTCDLTGVDFFFLFLYRFFFSSTKTSS